MLLNESKTLEYAVDGPGRIRVLEVLRSDELRPLVLTFRRRCFETAFAGAVTEEQVRDVEHQLLAGMLEQEGVSLTPGELFFSDDCVFYLTFDEDESRRPRAGIVYNSNTDQPVARFERFCGDVRDAIRGLTGETESLPDWEARAVPFPHGLARFIRQQDEDLVRATRFFEVASERTRAARLVANETVRKFLRRTQEARLEGYAHKNPSVAGEGDDLVPIEGLIEAGLMQREVRVTCRKTKHPLFDLPSPDALALITVSRAKCSLCAMPVVDEVIEEVFNPTALGLELVQDGNWLRNRVYRIIRDLGVPDYEIAPGPPSAFGESYVVANACGEPFLFAIRDGEFSPSFTRRMAAAIGETDARHLVVVVTGQVEEEARMRLYEYAWRRAREGKDVEVTIIGNPATLSTDLERALERVSLRSLARDLFALDASLGISANRLVMTTFKLWRRTRAPLHETQQPASNSKRHLFVVSTGGQSAVTVSRANPDIDVAQV